MTAVSQHQSGQELTQTLIQVINSNIIAIAVFELAMVINKEYGNKNEHDVIIMLRRTLPRFISTVCVALSLEGLIMVIKYMMENLGIQRVSCKILEYNIASRKSASKVGMKEEGVLRQAIYKNGKFHDIVCYSILKDEFTPVDS